MIRQLSRGLIAPLLLLVAGVSFAQHDPPQESSGLVTGWHIVRPGENLIRITTKYLGDSSRWRDTWKLNPDIENPHIIKPGTRLRVILDFDTAPPVARLRAVSGQVEERPLPIPWNEARVEDLLVEKDGLRTYRNSSTEIEFRDGTNLVLSEESLVFVRTSQRTTAGPKKRTVEIVEGQAEVQALAPGTPRTDVEILVGTAKATATQTEEGIAQARARKANDGSAQVMVYEGESEVEAAGQSVSVPRGMGTAVPQNAPPPPPEELLPAPVTAEPAAGAEYPVGNPWFAWEPVAGARAHTVEICSDALCAELVQRAADLDGSRWRPDPLPTGDLYWRVTAVAASGLDGYPSEPVPFKILFSGADAEPPTGEIRVTGRQAAHGGVTYYEARARLEATMSDDRTGLESWALEVDGRRLGEGEWAGPWPTGTHTARVVGVDRAGNRGASEPISFEVDADGPAVELRLGGKDLVEEKLGAGSVPAEWCARKKRWVKKNTRPLAGAWPVWALIAAGSDDAPIARSYNAERVLARSQRRKVRVEVAGDNPGVLLLAAGRLDIGPTPVTVPDGGDVDFCRPTTPGSPGFAKNAVLWVGASDELSGEVVSLSIKSVSQPATGSGERAELFLAIEAEDVLGNRRQVDLRFRPLSEPY